MEFVIIIFCIAGFIIIALFEKKRHNITRKLAAERKAISPDEFYHLLNNTSFSKTIVRAVYDKVLHFMKMKQCYIFPEDNMKEMLLLDEDEIKDFITDVSIKLDLKYPRLKQLTDYQEKYGEINTAKDIVRFVSTFNKVYILH